jgi:hypothetical protein
MDAASVEALGGGPDPLDPVRGHPALAGIGLGPEGRQRLEIARHLDPPQRVWD